MMVPVVPVMVAAILVKPFAFLHLF